MHNQDTVFTHYSKSKPLSILQLVLSSRNEGPSLSSCPICDEQCVAIASSQQTWEKIEYQNAQAY
jgi:hypothetical protein